MIYNTIYYIGDEKNKTVFEQLSLRKYSSAIILSFAPPPLPLGFENRSRGDMGPFCVLSDGAGLIQISIGI